MLEFRCCHLCQAAFWGLGRVPPQKQLCPNFPWLMFRNDAEEEEECCYLLSLHLCLLGILLPSRPYPGADPCPGIWEWPEAAWSTLGGGGEEILDLTGGSEGRSASSDIPVWELRARGGN